MREHIPPARGFTLMELLIGLTVVAILVSLAAPGMLSMIRQQRLVGIHRQVVTDLQYARSEAIARASYVRVRFQPQDSGGDACYVIYVDTDIAIDFVKGVNTAAEPTAQCDCKAVKPCSETTPGQKQLRLVVIPSDGGIGISPVLSAYDTVTFDPRTGGLPTVSVSQGLGTMDDFKLDTVLSSNQKRRASVTGAGRVQDCLPPGSKLTGAPACT